MPFGYPVMLEVRGRRIVVIGDEAVRAGKGEGPLSAGADDAPREPAAVGGGTRERGGWKADDLNGAALCIAAIADEGERGAIAREARCRRTLVNVVDDIPNRHLS